MSDIGERSQGANLSLNFSVDRLLEKNEPPAPARIDSPVQPLPRGWLDWATGLSAGHAGGSSGVAVKNRSPRVPFSRMQVQILEAKFQDTLYLSGLEVRQLALLLNISESRVKIWFQNRRARKRREEARIWRDSFREAAAAAAAAAAAVTAASASAPSAAVNAKDGTCANEYCDCIAAEALDN